MKILYYLSAITLIISCNEKPKKVEETKHKLTRNDSILRDKLLNGFTKSPQDSVVYRRMEKLYDSLSIKERNDLVEIIEQRGDFETESERSYELDRPAEDQSRY